MRISAPVRARRFRTDMPSDWTQAWSYEPPQIPTLGCEGSDHIRERGRNVLLLFTARRNVAPAFVLRDDNLADYHCRNVWTIIERGLTGR